MLDKNNQRVIFAQELFETFVDIKNHNLTATRLYVILIIIMIFVCGLAFFIALFFRQFFLSGLCFTISMAFYFLLINRKKRIIAKYLDWFSFLGSGIGLLTLTAHNIYNYSIASNAQVYVILMIDLLYLVFINATKKRIIAASATFFILLFSFVLLVLLDTFYWHSSGALVGKYNSIHIISELVTISSCVFSAYIVGIKSIDDIEQFVSYKTTTKNMVNVYNEILEKKEFVQQFLNIQKDFYDNLNVCVFEISIFSKEKNLFFKADSRVYDKIVKEFISLLKIYNFNNKVLILWDLNTLVLIAEDDSKIFFKTLSSIGENFNRLIKNKQNNYESNLKIISKYYKDINTKKHPRMILEKINEVIKLEYETQNIGSEYLLYKSDKNQEKTGVIND